MGKSHLMKKTICVFCGARSGHHKAYEQAAKKLGEIFAKNNIRLAYGGASIGLMGAISQSTLNHGGEVIGVIPQPIVELEVAANNLTELIIVSDMHQRKQKLHELSQGFICMPGGLGTLDEFFETATWKQLGYHHKPIGFLNTRSFYNPLFENIKHIEREGFLNENDINSLILEENPEKLTQEIISNFSPL